MGGFGSKPKYGDPMGKKEFNAAAERLMSETQQEYEELDKCVNNDERNLPVTLRCQAELSAWNGRVLQTFCKRLYDKAVKCQKGAGSNWAKECKEPTNEVVHCGDDAMRRLFQYNLERRTKPEEKGKKAAAA